MSPVLEVAGLGIGLDDGTPLVQDVAFAVAAGEVLGIVGESGSGKSLTAFAITGLLPRGIQQTAGLVRLQGEDLAMLTPAGRRALAGRRIGMVFQDPLSSFNPVRTVGSMLVESAVRHRSIRAHEARRLGIEALQCVRLAEPERAFDAYPHELSGGQRQRAMIALASLNEPALLIADEPTTALDATVQLQILALLKRRLGQGALLLITHDLGVAASLCDRLLVMQRGRVIEHGEPQFLLHHAQHPYTRRLRDAALALHGAAVNA
ncbi:MAG: ABC transporter ATP-binding protein [Steroidobacteraceae bacterium]